LKMTKRNGSVQRIGILKRENRLASPRGERDANYRVIKKL